MSPEQAAGDAFDGRSDLFSLGIVLYECATGQRPFVGNSARAILSAILHTAPMAPGEFNPDLPLRLQQVISDCLEKDPDLRYQNAASLRADLKRVKRDLESGRTGSVTPASDVRVSGHSADADGKRAPNRRQLAAPKRDARRRACRCPTADSVTASAPSCATDRRCRSRLARSPWRRIGYFRRSGVSTRPKRRRRLPRPRISCSRGSSRRSGACWQGSIVTRNGTRTTCWRRCRTMSKARAIRDQAAAFLRQAETDIDAGAKHDSGRRCPRSGARAGRGPNDRSGRAGPGRSVAADGGALQVAGGSGGVGAATIARRGAGATSRSTAAASSAASAIDGRVDGTGSDGTAARIATGVAAGAGASPTIPAPATPPAANPSRPNLPRSSRRLHR